MKKLVDRTDEIRNEAKEACDALDELKETLREWGHLEKDWPPIKKLQKRLLVINTQTTDLVEYVSKV